MAKRNPTSGPKLFGFSLIHPLNLVLFFNIFVWALLLMEGGKGILTHFFGLNPSLVIEKKMYWQVFTYGFLHVVGGDFFSSLIHIGMNMFGLFTVGFWLCRYIGGWKFLCVYLLSQLGGGLFVLSFSYIGWKTGFIPENSIWDSYHSATIGASGGVFGVLAAFSLMFPEARFVFPPVRAKFAPWVLIGFGFSLDAYYLFQYHSSGVMSHGFFGAMSNSGHLGGAVFGLLSLLGLQRFGRKTRTPVFVRRWEKPQENQERVIVRAKISGDPFEAQVRKNRDLLSQLYGISETNEKEKLLLPLQAENTNLCPPADYNPEDLFCLRCEWLQNCELRKLKGSDPQL
ncbi:rhomboid family intramembrane serine protease [Leptospira sarikeiensis]|uniref:Rhomboid family intramembrane serine protease n=1 Tax=Leptospira sarikeiensis TaxID=2484943 RepID=A0A4R9KFL4_9LEPT|nr:rhomboid family intramembrane serine protease [Leptospira sarikeiensis]